MNSYEGMLIFPVSLKDEALDAALDQARSEVVKLGGSVKDTRVLGKRTFARPLKKQDAGLYVRMYFELGPDAVKPLLARYKLNESIFRAQIVRAHEAPAEAEAKAPETEENRDGGS